MVIVDMRRLIDVNLWFQWLLYWLLLSWYSLAIAALIVLVATWSVRPLSSPDQVPWWAFVLGFMVIAVTYAPVSAYLNRNVHHLIYGQHDDAYEVVERVHQQLYTDPGADELLPTLAATLADALKLPYVAIQSGQDGHTPPMSTIYGTAPPHAELTTIPLRHQHRTLGTLNVSGRRSYDRLSDADLRLLDMLASQVGITLHAARLSDALQDSRTQLVTAREEERRRIRRDLHDGLGPTLAALRLQLSALRHTVGHNPDATQLIDELRADVRAATGEIRRLVYDLRPPMLDEFGLLGALHNLELTSDGMERSIEAPAELPPLPAAVEVALYRIAAEALHNSARHAQATRCTIRLALNAALLTLTVTDNGCGLPTPYLAGVGHNSMHERAAELGGSLSILPAPTGGTCVTATFQLKVV